MNMKEFEFVKSRESLLSHKNSCKGELWQFEMDCEKLGIRPTITRFKSWLDHWFREYYTYTMAKDEANVPFTPWKPKS